MGLGAIKAGITANLSITVKAGQQYVKYFKDVYQRYLCPSCFH
jgi:hypothetical protein